MRCCPNFALFNLVSLVDRICLFFYRTLLKYQSCIKSLPMRYPPAISLEYHSFLTLDC
jgi:hypothetical protein